MTNREYYELLLRSKDGIITVTVFGKNGGKQIFRCSSAEEIEEVVSAHLEGYNTYIDPNLRRTDLPEEELKLVARALLPFDITEGCRLHYEMMQYSIID